MTEPQTTKQPTPLTDRELDHLQALTDAASPGPWQPIIGHSSIRRDYIELGDEHHTEMEIEADGWPAPAADLEFIAASRNSLPRLLAEIRSQRS
jgi:hypothetical protein